MRVTGGAKMMGGAEMDCKHEFIPMNQELTDRLICAKCWSTAIELTLQNELAAANAEIEQMKCCGNCINWINRPEKMSCKIHEIDVARWCRCGEWQVKEVPPCSE